LPNAFALSTITKLNRFTNYMHLTRRSGRLITLAADHRVRGDKKKKILPAERAALSFARYEFIPTLDKCNL